MARRDIRINSKGFILVFVSPYNHGLCQPRTIFFYDNRDNKDNKEKKDNSRILNAFALTARMDNAQLHPGCRCALPWAMFFCAYSACWSIFSDDNGMMRLSSFNGSENIKINVKVEGITKDGKFIIGK